MIDILSMNDMRKNKDRTKEQLKNKVKAPEMDKEKVLDHIHDAVDFGCTETVHPNDKRIATLGKVREVLESGVDPKDVKVTVTIDDVTEKNMYYTDRTDLNGLLKILGL